MDLAGLKPFAVREMMNGTREGFEYVTCSNCQCVQLLARPREIGRYYVDYYGRSKVDTRSLTYRLRLIRFRVALGESKNLLGMLHNYLIHDPAPTSLRSLKRTGSVLDVGCASGELLLLMKDTGFTDVRGCDPMIQSAIQYENGVSVSKHTLDEEPGTFDVVMAHHVMEHVPDQAAFAAQLYAKVKVGGTVLVRVPTISSWAYEEFGCDWYQLDAPRHFYLHSRKSIVQVLEGAGFVDITVSDDSTIRQILSSRLYRQDVPYTSHIRRYVLDLPRMILTGELWRMNKQVRILNAEGRGDQICVYAHKKD